MELNVSTSLAVTDRGDYSPIVRSEGAHQFLTQAASQQIPASLKLVPKGHAMFTKLSALRILIVTVITGIFALGIPSDAVAQTTLSSGPLLVNQGSNMCLGVPGATTNIGVQLVQWYCNGSSDQNWLLASNSSFDSGGQTYAQFTDQLSGQCISVAGASLNAGAAVVQWPCYGTADQYWTMVHIQDAYFELVNFNSGMCLGVASGSLSAGAKVVQWPCYGPPDQHWRYPAPGRPRVSNDFTILVNGSFDDSPDWMDPGSDEFVAIGNTFGGQEVDFRWSGNDVFFPAYSSIYDAGFALANFINSHSFSEGEGLNIVAHSHGGNVVKIATTLGLSHPINNLVNLGTPQNFDLPFINTSAVINYCQVSSLADFTQVFGASPLQVAFFISAQIDAAFWEEQAIEALDMDDYDSFAIDEAIAAGFEADAAFWFFSTKIDVVADNVLFGSESHSDLHTVPVWNLLRYTCGLPN